MMLEAILRKYTLKPITTDALLEDLHLDGIKPASAADLDEVHNIEIPDREVDSWQTVSDIERTVGKLKEAA